ncbi:16S rRNA (guanine(527)-N(7))-methyltransferase RsmG [Cellulomonas sp. DKR-3]|uniref:Ribosomal RNA small subunit methyltransferase G n=1 Tax=Cellulomonas fulva TaxID=2835530 RepID=A0ABS5TWG4_9CELL|nr:16S rRNA (guanine(527)-N(7))-methyltransferase RsmG [Cellulomonas fulva]MBT0993495.1 16S rRNA (guanine(527)-N(7))-methyltransferase RsmG [Cellulomonas fulva]
MAERHDEERVERDPLSEDPRLPEYFGPAWPTVEAFHRLLTEQGVLRGLIGPREVSRLWERHLLNSAAVVPYLPENGTVVDLGSGAGLPGVVVAAMLPRAHVILLEPMERRTDWLTEVVERLELAHVTVRRGRAQEALELQADVVTTRAVASLEKLYAWAVPLIRPGGRLVALKGGRAEEEIAAGRRAAQRAKLIAVDLHEVATLDGVESTRVVVAQTRGAA